MENTKPNYWQNAERTNGRMAMMGFFALVVNYGLFGWIIPGIFQMVLLSVTFYDFPSSPLLVVGALGIVVALAIFFLAYQKYFNSPLNKEIQNKKKSLLNEQKELNLRLEKIGQELKNL